MSSSMQLIVALGIVLLAAGLLVARARRLLAGRGCAGGCAKCDRNAEPADGNLVQLESPQPGRAKP